LLINDLAEFSRVGRGSVIPAQQECEEALRAALETGEEHHETGARVTHDALPTVPARALLTTLLQKPDRKRHLKFSRRAASDPSRGVVERDGEFTVVPG